MSLMSIKSISKMGKIEREREWESRRKREGKKERHSEDEKWRESKGE